MRRLCTLFATVAALATAGPAAAGQLVANASQNPTGQVSNPSSGSSVSAWWPDQTQPIAWSTTTRWDIQANALGAGTQMPVHQAASGTANTSYTLWDLGSGAALAPEIAGALTLSFNFRVAGTTEVDAISLSTASVNFDAALYSQIADAHGDGLSVVYGPVPPFPSEDYLYTGNVALAGNYDVGFSLLHVGSVGGLWTMGLSTSASHQAAALSTLWLDSITLAGGVLPANGLAVRLETGELMAVTTVPEVPPWALLLAGSGWAALLARRRLRG